MRIYFIVFLSGVSALIFESLFFRLAGLVFGNSVYAASIVLASFMAGLALGSILMVRFGNRITSPMRLYAIIQFVIAVSGYGLVALFPHFTEFFTPVLRAYSDSPFVLGSIRTILAVSLMIIPATAMGCTLPIIVKALSTVLPNFGTTLGSLYGWNTFGAVAGVLLNEFFFIARFGIQGAGVLAGFFNIASLMLAVGVANKIHRPIFASKPPAECARAVPARATGAIYTIIFFSGFLLLSLEVIWFRFLALFTHSTSLLFAIMLSVVLSGIATGGLIAAYLFKKQKNAQNFLGFVFAAAGILILILYLCFPFVWVFLRTFTIYVQQIFASLYLMFPVSACSGIIYTMLGKHVHAYSNDEAVSSGLLTGINTCGAACGSLIAGLFFIPVLGVEISFFIFSVAYGVLMCVVFYIHLLHRAANAKAAISVIAIFIGALTIFPFGSMKNIFLPMVVAQSSYPGTLVASREGINETLQYVRVDLFGKPYSYRLITNSHSMSATDPVSKRYMSFYAYLPMAVHSHIRDSLLICYGCGTTAQAILDIPQLRSLDIVDISKDIFDMSSVIYPEHNENPLNNSKVKTYIEDGRFFLLTRARTYDLITAEPPPPKSNGVTNLYSREYFQLMYNRLNPGGIATYWLPVEQLDADEAKAILRAFCDVFSNCSLWSGTLFDWMMVGIKEPYTKVSYNHFTAPWSDPAARLRFQSLEFRTPQEFGANFIADRERILRWIGAVPALTDDFPYRVGYQLPPRERSIQEYLAFVDPADMRDAFMSSAHIAAIWPKELIEKTSNDFFHIPMFLRLVRNKNAYSRVDVCLKNPGMARFMVWAAYSSPDAQRSIGEARARHSMQKYIPTSEDYLHLAADALCRQDLPLAESYYARMPHESWSPAAQLRVYLAYRRGDIAAARQLKNYYLSLCGRYATVQRDKNEQEINTAWKWLQSNFAEFSNTTAE